MGGYSLSEGESELARPCEEEALLKDLLAHAQTPPESARSKGFWSKMKEALGA